MNDSIAAVSAIATPTIAIVSLVKVAFPRASSWVYILSAITAGIVISVLSGIATDTLTTTAAVAQAILEGVNAALVASGVHHLDKHSSSRRARARDAVEGSSNGAQTETPAGKRKTV